MTTVDQHPRRPWYRPDPLTAGRTDAGSPSERRRLRRAADPRGRLAGAVAVGGGHRVQDRDRRRAGDPSWLGAHGMTLDAFTAMLSQGNVCLWAGTAC